MPKDENLSFSLEPILAFKMTKQESEAFKACLIWMALCQKVLPDYKFAKLPAKGDPRKCHLFRSCWKLLRETNGTLDEKELGLYVRAQLEILRGIKRGDGTHVMIDPVCLTGDKAWTRWKLWRSRYRAASREENQSRGVESKTPLFKIAAELEKTKNFFSRFYDHGPSREELTAAVENGNLRRWVALGKVSPYYVLMSPFAISALKNKPEDYFSVDLLVYSPDVTPEAHETFKKLFPHEI